MRACTLSKIYHSFDGLVQVFSAVSPKKSGEIPSPPSLSLSRRCCSHKLFNQTLAASAGPSKKEGGN